MSIPGQTIGVSAFTESLLKDLNIDRDELSLAYMVGTVISSVFLPWAGRVYDQKGVRPVATFAAIALGGVLVFFSQLDTVVNYLSVELKVIPRFFILFMGFLFLRFFGQGVITMVSRNMVMKWFDQRRGLASGFSNVFVSLGFSYAPALLSFLIISYDWHKAYLYLACIVGAVFPIIVLVFFRNSPQEHGLRPDGDFLQASKTKHSMFKVVKEHTSKEVLRSYSFWVFAGMLAMQGLYITGFTFHVVSLFASSGWDQEAAFAVFQPIAVVAVITTLIFSSMSDYITLKYLLYIKGFGAFLGIGGVILLDEWDGAYLLIWIGHGMMTGLYSILNSVVWPRYFGLKHLGAISGQSVRLTVFGSAIGPILFSRSLTLFDSYHPALWLCLFVFIGLTIAAVRADNPQKRFEDS